MRLLLDTHVLLWWAHEPGKLTPVVLDAVGDPENDIYVSAVSAMEIAIKHRLARLEYPTPLATNFSTEVAALGFDELAIVSSHALKAGGHAAKHRDPWDRLLAAQTVIENLTLVSKDREMHSLGAPTLW